MIKTWNDYKEYRHADIVVNAKRMTKKDILLLEHSYYIGRYLHLLRLDEYFTNRKSILHQVVKVVIRRRRNRLAVKLGFTISPNCFGKGLLIWHYGNIVVNGDAKVGENCILHGDNCIGNNGSDTKAPIIGDNVDIGVGAKIIGDIYIADNCKIGAGAVVVKSCYHQGATLVGIPAKEIGVKG
ncbi:serine O-acetyltransferase [Mediterraneibacter glycyrrhizinilyticus]|uniref:serine O-acetyltransferase n=1 Tax=Mediterraneibacter glycyrrhizinilyticus TaxID=342942 RepID=UPI0025A4A5C9|nr:serine acetyltransferase [Mediterraneibacter glycyrrhizinilyticus]MDM8125530.1 serine acetyltransferase [Mediterraneibacter glycyrrhizinilyticus]